LRDRLEGQGVVVHDMPLGRTGLNPLADLRSLLFLLSLMRRVRPDMVLGYTIKPVIYGTLAATLAGVPRRFALITGLGHAFQERQEGGWLRALVQKLYGVALRGAHKVFFQNPDDEALFRQLGLVGPGTGTIVVNGSGVDVSEYTAAPVPEEHSFLLIARLLGDKGVREYADAARRIKQLHPATRFRLVGWIDDNPNSIRQSELDAWTGEGTLEHLGRLNDVRPAIAQSSVFVLPSYYREGTPRTVLEAMAMGRAIITTDMPGCRETVVNSENGYLVPPRSVDALVGAMLQFVEKPGLASAMGRRSRQIAENKYDVHAVNAVMLGEMGLGSSV
jgi:glycosyltransferase involved in cell wall biosynthesis